MIHTVNHGENANFPLNQYIGMPIDPCIVFVGTDEDRYHFDFTAISLRLSES